MEEVGTISMMETKSIFLCRDVAPEHIGREIYADNVETPYSFYLIRKLNLAKDYQNLAEGEAFFGAISDSWAASTEFENLAIKKIYMYVETEVMFYTVLFGSFEPLVRSQKVKLKEWMAKIAIEKVDRPLVHNGALATNNDELKIMMKQLMETSNEIFRLRKIINQLNDNMSVAKIETDSEMNPVISRSIRTIHLKRAQPILVEEEDAAQEKKDLDRLMKLEGVTKPKKNVEAVTESRDEIATALAVGPETDVVGKKSEIEVAEKKRPFLKELQREKPLPMLGFDLKKDLEEPILVETSLSGKKAEQEVLAEKPKTLKRIVKTDAVEPVDFQRMVLQKENTQQIKPRDWGHFSEQLGASESITLPDGESDFSKTEMEKLEDKIYFRFVNKRVRGATKKSHTQKKSISRVQLLDQIGQAEYLNYSWGQVLKERKEDFLICGRLSSANLVSAMDEFLQEMREIAYSRSLFGQKVRCSADRLRRLEGYVLMDQYMQKLSFAPIDFGERKGYF